jgi:anaerobic ribonucleoside-triphosphate reductase activating protein
MRIAGIVRDSIVDGSGVRDVIFVQGCSHHCKGCHNKETWNYNGGTHWFVGDIAKHLSDSSNNVTISGGEPMEQFQSLLRLCKMLKDQNKNIWLYTGCVVDPKKIIYTMLANYVDVIVDGRFIEELKDPNLLFRGSSNQRIIDLPKTVKANEIVLWEECE